MTALDATEMAERLAAVERRLTDGDGDARPSAVEARVSELETRADEIEDRLDALRDLVGEVERVDDDIERRADAALAGVDDLDARVTALETGAETDARLAAEAAREPPAPPEQTDDDPDGGRSALGRLRDAL